MEKGIYLLLIVLICYIGFILAAKGQILSGKKEFHDVKEFPNDLKPVPIDSDSWKSPDSPLFISIAAYRDGARCGKTIQKIFEKAKYPDRIHIGE